jgi:hypothetical protein
MRKLSGPFCEEIALNFLAAHFYPELLPLAFNFPTSSHIDLDEMEEFDQKCACVRKLIGVLGYVPVFNQRRGFAKTPWANPNLPKVIELKKQQLLIEIRKGSSPGRNLGGRQSLL